MDRIIVYPGALPQDTDILNTNLNAMIALGYMAQSVFGTTTVATGLACVPTAPASLVVNVGQGGLWELEVIDTTSYGSLASNSNPLMKMGVNFTGVTPFTCAAPGTAGHSIDYLIEVTFLEEDNNPVVLPYYNALNPSQPYSGPNNSGDPQNTIRIQRASLQLKAGVSASTGTQVPPAVDAGWFGLYVVTVNNGQTQIIAADIAVYPGAPFLAQNLAALAWSGQLWVDGGTANAISIKLTPGLTALSQLTGIALPVLVAAPNTGATTISINGLGPYNVINPDGSALVSGQLLGTGTGIALLVGDGTHFQLQSSANGGSVTQNSWSTAIWADTGSANALAVTLSPVPASLAALIGQVLTIGKSSSGNTAGVTLNPNSLGATSLLRSDGTALPSGWWSGSSDGQVVYNGAQFILLTAPTPAVLNGSVPAATSGLKVIVTSSTALTITAHSISVLNGVNGFTSLSTFSQSIATSINGAGGLDTGTIASSTWYFVYAIYGTSGTSALISLSSTSPTLPVGYTYFARIGAVKTDGSSNLYYTLQYGKRAQFVVGTNPSTAIVLTSGSASYGAVSIVGAVPTTASVVFGALGYQNLNPTSIGANSTYAQFKYDYPSMGAQNSLGAFQLTLESTNIYYAGGGSVSAVYLYGWEDNL